MEKNTTIINKNQIQDDLTSYIKELRNLVSLSQRWLSMSEACIYSKMSKNTLMLCINDGEIQAVKRRGKWIVDRLSIDSYYTDFETETRVKDLLNKRRV